MLRDSPDQVIHKVSPDVRTGRKWDARKEVEKAEAVLKLKDTIGAVQTGTSRVGTRYSKRFGNQSTMARGKWLWRKSGLGRSSTGLQELRHRVIRVSGTTGRTCPRRI